jgi:hypothetical protein
MSATRLPDAAQSKRGRFYNVVDLVNRLETETRNGRQGRIAEHLTRMDKKTDLIEPDVSKPPGRLGGFFIATR